MQHILQQRHTLEVSNFPTEVSYSPTAAGAGEVSHPLHTHTHTPLNARPDGLTGPLTPMIQKGVSISQLTAKDLISQ